MPEVNALAVLAATVGSFVLGGLWYSPILFGEAWQKAVGLSDERLKAGNPALIYGVSFVLAALASYTFAMFLGPKPGIGFGFGAGLCAGLCWVATSFGINALFEHRPLGLTLINAGYHTIQFTLIGVMLGWLG